MIAYIFLWVLFLLFAAGIIVSIPERERIYAALAFIFGIPAIVIHVFGPESEYVRTLTYIMFGCAGVCGWVAALNIIGFFNNGLKWWAILAISVETILLLLYAKYVPELFAGNMNIITLKEIILMLGHIALLAGSTLPVAALFSWYVLSYRNRNGYKGGSHIKLEDIKFKKHIARAINSLHLK